MQEKTLLLSIRPKYAQMIFAGDKTMELRRTRPKLGFGDWVVVYISAPTMKIFGAFQVKRVIATSPAELWSIASKHAQVSFEEYSKYYAAASIAFGICISHTVTFKTQISLAQLRSRLPHFHPPQTYRYLQDNELQMAGVSDRFPRLKQVA